MDTLHEYLVRHSLAVSSSESAFKIAEAVCDYLADKLEREAPLAENEILALRNVVEIIKDEGALL